MFLAARNGDNDIEFFSGAFSTSDFARGKNNIIENIKKQLRFALKQRKIDLRFNNMISTGKRTNEKSFCPIFLIFHWPAYKIIFPFRSFKTTMIKTGKRPTDN